MPVIVQHVFSGEQREVLSWQQLLWYQQNNMWSVTPMTETEPPAAEASKPASKKA